MSRRLTTRFAVSLATLMLATTVEVRAQADSPDGVGHWSRSSVPGGYIEWRFVESPRRFDPPARRGQPPYRWRSARRDGYVAGRTTPDAKFFGRNRAPQDERPWRYRYDERRGVWLAERFT